MTLAIAFWIFWLIGLIFGVVGFRDRDYVFIGNSVLLWFLLFLLGWATFGAPLK